MIWLSTLRRGGLPPTTQDSLPAAGPALPDGIGYPQGSDKRFHIAFLLFRASWRKPGRSRDFSLELPQIRACTLNAPGSSHCGIAVPHTTGWFRGDTLVRHGILGVVPTPRPQRGTPFAPRGPGGPFPRFNTTMGHCDSLPSISPRFVSFAWRYHRCVPCSSPSAQDLAGDHPGVFNPVLLPAGTMETARSPKFPGNPGVHSPCSPTPV